ncbi:MAG: hypothetical protein KDB14_34270 [Planctomycetales bacterium]|nr:hypothetical protein [Planctomycetales bacterium]
MAITVYEKFGSPDGRFVNPVDGAGSAFTYTYVVLGTNNVTLATSAVATAAPLVYLANDGQLLVRQEFIPKVTGPNSWDIDVRYGTEDDRKSHEIPEAGFWRFSFDTTGGTHKVTQSLETIHRVEADPADPAPDLKQAIGWDGKKVNGVEIVVPKLEFSITAYYDPASVTTAYMKTLARNTGRTNSAAWLGFDPGEVLYMGSTGDGDVPLVSGARVKPIPLVHKFAASENVINLAVGDMTVPSKNGFDYLWVRYKQIESADATNIVPKPVHAYVERVYEKVDFAALLGVS